jgi:hypothetical protein
VFSGAGLLSLSELCFVAASVSSGVVLYGLYSCEWIKSGDVCLWDLLCSNLQISSPLVTFTVGAC